jgi:hypothetical protein
MSFFKFQFELIISLLIHNFYFIPCHYKYGKREPNLVKALQAGVEKSKKGQPLKAKIVKNIAYFDQEYNHRSFYNLVFALNKTHDRNVLFKTFVNLGIII